MQWLKHTESNYHHYFLDLLLLFYYVAIQDNLYMMIPFCSDLLFANYNIINQHYQK